MAQINQRPLRGEGLAERKEVCKKANETFMKLFKGEEYDKEIMKEFNRGMSEDIIRERKRIGGDWAIAAVTLTCDIRDHIRYPWYRIR